MYRPLSCPTCASRFADIRGVVYSNPEGNLNDNHQCGDPWHKGTDYDPDVLVFTPEDVEFLAKNRISSE